MTARHRGPVVARVVALTTLLLITVLLVLGIVLTALAGEPLFNSLLNVGVYPFAVVGALIAVRRPRNPIGWLCLTSGAAFSLDAAFWGAALYGFAHPGTVPQPAFFAIVGEAFQMPGVFLVTTLVFLLFPDGRLPSPRWRWLAWTSSILLAGGLVTGLFLPTTSGWGKPLVENPYGSQLAADINVLFIGLFACMVATLVALIRRFRRSAGVERLQMRWLATAGTGAVAFWLIATVVLWAGAIGEAAAAALSMAGFVLIPLAVGVAVLRYRLFEIDRVISRTVSYGLVIGVLVAVYAGGVLLLRMVSPWEGELAVAVSTLAVAALFNPLRRRVQVRVNRRFHRARYDAEQEMERFAGLLRDQLDPDDVSESLLGAVERALQPSEAGVWIVPGTGR